MQQSTTSTPSAIDEAAASSSSMVTDDDLATCIRVLNSLSPDGEISDEYREPRCKPLRIAVQRFLDDAAARQFHGQTPDKYARFKEKKRLKNAREQQERALDRDAADKSRMRAERLRMLGELEASAAEASDAPRLAFVPDGAVETNGGGPKALTLAADSADAMVEEGGTHDETGVELKTLHSCYTCKARFRVLHHFYAQLCPTCASLNYSKRLQSCDLSGQVFLVTGGRVKVGYQVVLKLLRCGASVLATSRFPADAASRFAKASDSSEWMDRLQCYGLDLRDLSSLERFCAHLIQRNQRLDGIINNACQTIRRPAAYYSHLLPNELQPALWGEEVKALLCDNERCFAPPQPQPQPQLTDVSDRPPVTDGVGSSATTAMASTSGASSSSALTNGATTATTAAVPSALWSQAPLWSAEEGVMQPDEGTASNFPIGLTDVNGQQVDTRTSNSWLLKLQEVSTPEAAEVLAINALAPFILNSRLRCLLEASPSQYRHVINVSAMEGKFYRYKSPNHPHTNMAKAALNMMTRTCADEMASNSQIYMNSVDTGWINDEKPIEKAAMHAEQHHFQTPLDEIDAASRILDPVLCGEKPTHGKFLKDYAPCEW